MREETASRPFSSWIHGGHDTTGAEQAMTAITRGFGMRLAAAPLAFTAAVTPERIEAAEDLGGTVAWLLV